MNAMSLCRSCVAIELRCSVRNVAVLNWLQGRAATQPLAGPPVEESLALFDDMRRGMLDEGEATLRCAAAAHLCPF